MPTPFFPVGARIQGNPSLRYPQAEGHAAAVEYFASGGRRGRADSRRMRQDRSDFHPAVRDRSRGSAGHHSQLDHSRPDRGGSRRDESCGVLPDRRSARRSQSWPVPIGAQRRRERPPATQTTRDAIASVALALATATELLGRPLLEDLTDPTTGQLTPIFLVTDKRAVLQELGLRAVHRLPARAQAHPNAATLTADQTASSSATTAPDRSALARLARRRRRDDRDGRRLPRALQPHSPARDARRRTPDRALPHRPRHHAGHRRQRHSAKAPKCADPLTRDTLSVPGARYWCDGCCRRSEAVVGVAAAGIAVGE